MQSVNLASAIKRTGGTSTLLISSFEKGIDLGSDINFKIISNKLSFEIKPANASKKKIVIGSSLKRLAAKVY